MKENMRVKLQDIADALCMQFDEQQQFVNLETGDVICVQTDHLCMAEDIEDPALFMHPVAWEKEAVLEAYDVLISDNKYLRLPDKYEVNGYETMEAFCLLLPPHLSRVFLSAIRGRGAFRRFREMLIEHQLLEQWYDYEQKALLEIARAWCVENRVQYE